jgi:hypothetical protein
VPPGRTIWNSSEIACRSSCRCSITSIAVTTSKLDGRSGQAMEVGAEDALVPAPAAEAKRVGREIGAEDHAVRGEEVEHVAGAAAQVEQPGGAAFRQQPQQHVVDDPVLPGQPPVALAEIVITLLLFAFHGSRILVSRGPLWYLRAA